MIVRWQFFRPMSSQMLKNPCLKLLSSSSVSSTSTPAKTLKDRSTENSSGSPVTEFRLSTQIIESTLSRCPSDILSLSFFLWCAHQPYYFHSPQSFDRMIPIVTRLTGRFESVKGVVGELESIGCCRKAQTFLVLLRIFWRAGMHRLALEAFDEMGSFGYVPNTFARNIVIDILFRIGHVNLGLKVLRETQFPNFLTYNTVICNLSKLNDWLGVRDVLKLMMRGGFSPNIGTFSMVMNRFCKAGRLMESLQVLGLIITSGIQLSVTMWSILIDGFCKAGRVSFACQLLRNMVASRCRPNVIIYTSLIKGFFEARMFDEALNMLNNMESEGCLPDLVFYNMFIDCLCKAGMYDEAVDAFRGLSERNLRPDSYTFSSLLSTICLSRKFTLLPGLVGGLDVTVDLMVCNSLLNVFCKAGFPLEAVAFYNDMVDRGFAPDNYSYAGLLNGLCRAGQVEDAVCVYHGMIVNGSCLDAHVHTVVFDGLIKAGKSHKAIGLFRKAVAENFSVDAVTYGVAIQGLFKGGRFGEACSLFRQMKEAGFFPNICTYHVMISGLFKARDMNEVKWLLKDMAVAGIQPDSTLFNIMIGFLCRSCCVRAAFHLFIEMHSLGLKPSMASYVLLVDTLFRLGKVDDACLLLKSYSEDLGLVESPGSNLPDMLFPFTETLGRFSKLKGNALRDMELEEKNRDSVLCL